MKSWTAIDKKITKNFRMIPSQIKRNEFNNQGKNR